MVCSTTMTVVLVYFETGDEIFDAVLNTLLYDNIVTVYASDI